MTHSAQLPIAYGPAIGVDTARTVAAAAIAEARRNGWLIAVAVADSSGDLVVFERIDNTQLGSVEISQHKARTAARFKRPTKAFAEALAGGRQGMLALADVVPLEGGLPLVIDGKIAGAIGVSGAPSPEEDGVCARAGAGVLGGGAPPPAR